ncbi:MAG: sugar-transfer associated ATP-grasp domain-containing protein [Porticoccaceae bacterium]
MKHRQGSQLAMEHSFPSTALDPPKKGTTLEGVARQTLQRAREGHLPVSRQLVEMAALKLFHGIGPGLYHSARLWRRGLPWRFKKGFWPYHKFRRFVATINPPAYQKLSQNKFCEKAILALASIPTAQFLGHLHHQRGSSASGEKLTNAAELGHLLTTCPAIDKVCFKLVEGYGGQGFQAIQVSRNGGTRARLLDSGQVLTLEDFLATLQVAQGKAYIVEQYVSQHAVMAALNPSSVNTLRVWASCIDGQTAVIDAFLRVGRRGSLVDNTSRGAQIFKVDLRSGVIGTGMVKSICNETFQCHKDTGEAISGVSLPFWPESLTLAQRAVSAFPAIAFAGVDIAITESGPLVIELNVEPDPTSAIIFDRCHEDLFSDFLQ